MTPDPMFDHEGNCAICDAHFFEHDVEGKIRCREAFDMPEPGEDDGLDSLFAEDARKCKAGTCNCFSPVMEG